METNPQSRGSSQPKTYDTSNSNEKRELTQPHDQRSSPAAGPSLAAARRLSPPLPLPQVPHPRGLPPPATLEATGRCWLPPPLLPRRRRESSPPPVGTVRLVPAAWPWFPQELTVVLDFISTVEANDTVAVATISKPKPLPDKVLVDMAFSASTKLQCLRHLVQYFKQSAKMIEQQFQKEARFYGSLIRLQNWKVKGQRGNAPGSNSFMFDVVDTSQLDTAAMPRLSSLYLVPIDQDSSGTLSVQIREKSCRFLSLKYRGDSTSGMESYACKRKVSQAPLLLQQKMMSR